MNRSQMDNIRFADSILSGLRLLVTKESEPIECIRIVLPSVGRVMQGQVQS